MRRQAVSRTLNESNQSWLAVGLVSVTLSGCLAFANQETQRHVREIQKMATTLEITPAEQPYIAGGPMPIRLVLTNTGGTTVSVPASGRGSPFDYLLRTTNGTDIASASSAMFDAALSGGSVPIEREMALVAPGETVAYEDDIAAYLLEDLPPQQYQLVASVGTDEGVQSSAPAQIQVVAPEVIHVSHALNMTKTKLTSTFVLSAEDSLKLLSRVSSRERPDLGVSRPVLSARIADIKLAYEADAGPDQRWALWLYEGGIGGGVIRPYDARHTFENPTSNAQALAILAGYQYATGLADFVLSVNVDGMQRIDLFRITGSSEFALVEGVLTVPGETIGITLEPGDSTLIASWYEESGDGSKLLVARIDLAGAGATAPREIFSTPRTVLSMRSPEARRDADDTLNLLLGSSSGDSAILQLVGIDLSGDREPASVDIPMPKIAASQYWLADTLLARPLVAACDDAGTLDVYQDGEWENIDTIGEGVRHVELVTMNSGETWLNWYNPSRGSLWRLLH